MKQILFLITIVLMALQSFAQTPHNMSYQAVVRNSSNNLVTNSQIGMRISIIQGTDSGTTVYSETQTPTSNVNGLISIEIGNGTVFSGTFSNIDWANGPYFIKTETDPTGGTNYSITGTSQLLSVPYALHAKTAGTVTGEITETDPYFLNNFKVTNPTDGQLLRYNSFTGKWENFTLNKEVIGDYYYLDKDGDGFGNQFSAVWVPAGGFDPPNHYVFNFGDCDDSNSSINTNGLEECDGIDNNCNGQVDENCKDDDADGYIEGIDCDDQNAAVHPDAIEECTNGIDDDCNGLIDETVFTYYLDADNDGYGNNQYFVVSCTPPSGYVYEKGDCDDNNSSINPGVFEIEDGKDNDCDGRIDEKTKFYQDNDKDSYGNQNVSIDGYFPVPTGYAQYPGDCNDENAAVNPGHEEICDNTIDDNCNGIVDEGCVDADLDGYRQNADCDDTDGTVHPGAEELCDGIDNNCDDLVDEGCIDSDGDGSIDEIDCDDTDGSIYPGANEICDGIDNNCNGQVDEGQIDSDGDGIPDCVDCNDIEVEDGIDNDCDGLIDEKTTFYQDKDKDGYGNSAVSIQGYLPAPDGYVTNFADCDDLDAGTNPNANEKEDGIDNDCDGMTDEKTTFYQDNDRDGFGNPTVSTQGYLPAPNGYVPNNGDCNDDDASINPGNEEIPGNGKDDNCDGITE